MQRSLLLTLTISALLSACGGSSDQAPAAPAATATPAPVSEQPATAPAAASNTLAQWIAGDHRSAEDKARDGARHPQAMLEFFRLQPTDTVLEVTPGGGWWTDILAPYLRDQGRYIALSWDDTVEGAPKYYADANAKLRGKFEAKPDLYGKAQITLFNAKEPGSFGEPASVDLVVTFRNTHGWIGGNTADAMYKGFFDVLKPGGRLGVEQHRANAGTDPAETAKTGYVSEEAVIAIAEKAGFKLLDKSEINANPKDTKDYPKGVWTLPPNFAEGDTDREKYAAIGESDRMTLLFEKPGAAAPAAVVTPGDQPNADGFEQDQAAKAAAGN
jgi:predicted methyltransferase